MHYNDARVLEFEEFVKSKGPWDTSLVYKNPINSSIKVLLLLIVKNSSNYKYLKKGLKNVPKMVHL